MDIYPQVTGKSSAGLTVTDALANPTFCCPSLSPTIKALAAHLIGGFGWNHEYLGWRMDLSDYVRIKIGQIQKPGQTIMIGDTLDFNVAGAEYTNYLLFSPTTFQNNFGYFVPNAVRHNKGLNMTFADGHCAWFSSSTLMLPQNNPYLYERRKSY